MRLRSYCAKVIDTVLATGIPKGSFLNVNVPNLPQASIKGIRLTKQGSSAYNEYFKEVTKEVSCLSPFLFLRGLSLSLSLFCVLASL
jgi:broad specificity polyphosphatase/5'/3'-nucleotidase SurE